VTGSVQTETNTRLAIVVCTLNRQAASRWLVTYIDELAQRACFNFRLSMVLVESSEEPTRFFGEPEVIDFFHVRSEPGLPHQRNVGVNFVLETLPDVSSIVFLDDDVIPSSNFLRTVAEGNFPQGSRAIGSFDALKRESWQARLAEKIGVSPMPGRISRGGFATAPRADYEGDELDWIPGFAFAIHRDVFGHFSFPEDVDFFGEDVLFGIKLRTKEQLSIPDGAVVFHSPFGVRRRGEGDDYKHKYLLAHKITGMAIAGEFSRTYFWAHTLMDFVLLALPALVSPSWRIRFLGLTRSIVELAKSSKVRRSS